jgi:hypothetical protein
MAAPRPKAPGTYLTVAMGWVQDRPGLWTRYLIRVDRRTPDDPQISRLTWVDAGALFCPACLSQDLDAVQMDVSPVDMRCRDCHARSAHDVLDTDPEFYTPDEAEEDDEPEQYGSTDFLP